MAKIRIVELDKTMQVNEHGYSNIEWLLQNVGAYSEAL